MYYKLDENKNVKPSSLEEWATFIEKRLPTNYWIVGKDDVNGYHISTVFIGLCHNSNPSSKVPIVFETMIFLNGETGFYQERYSTWEEAEEGHRRAVQWVKDGCPDLEGD